MITVLRFMYSGPCYNGNQENYLVTSGISLHQGEKNN